MDWGRRIYDRLRKMRWHRAGSAPMPSAAFNDGQMAKMTEFGGERGVDSGRKRHIVVNTLGLLLTTIVRSVGLQDQDGAGFALLKLRRDPLK